VHGYLSQLFYRSTRHAISSNAVQEVMGVLEARAREGASHEVYVRVAFHDGIIYLDLGGTPREKWMKCCANAGCCQ